MNDGRSAPLAWCFFELDAVPEQWRDRARKLAFVPLLPDEAAALWDHVSQPNERDNRFLGLVAAGRSRREIARTLNLPLRTVDRRLSSLVAGFGLATTQELVAMLARRGF